MVNETQASTAPARRISLKLVLVLFAALLLCSIPIMPIRWTLLRTSAWQPVVGHLVDQVGGVLNQLTGLGSAGKRQALGQASSEREQAPVGGGNLSSLDVAARQLETEIEKDPGNPLLHNQIGLIYAGLGDNDKAVFQFQKAVELARSKLAAIYAQEKGQSAQSIQGEQEASASLILESSRLEVELSAAHSSLARIYDKLGQHDLVVTELDALNRETAFGSRSSALKMEPPLFRTGFVHRLSSTSLQLLTGLRLCARLTVCLRRCSFIGKYCKSIRRRVLPINSLVWRRWTAEITGWAARN